MHHMHTATPEEKNRTMIRTFVTLTLLAACGFPSEGTGEVANPTHYSPPRPDGHRIDLDPDGPASSTDTDTTDGTGPAADESSDDEDSSGPGETGEDSSAGGSSSSSTGEPAEYDDAHCDASCPEADRIREYNTDFPYCVCAPTCSDFHNCDGTPCHDAEPNVKRCYFDPYDDGCPSVLMAPGLLWDDEWPADAARTVCMWTDGGA
jgi:hypothetical protein